MKTHERNLFKEMSRRASKEEEEEELVYWSLRGGDWSERGSLVLLKLK